MEHMKIPWTRWAIIGCTVILAWLAFQIMLLWAMN